MCVNFIWYFLLLNHYAKQFVSKIMLNKILELVSLNRNGSFNKDNDVFEENKLEQFYHFKTP